jgi:DNA polymerase III alpha subunit (gram-positive type)
MKLAKDKYIIVELIPTTLKKETGDIIQLSALKIENLQITGRFDYRLHEDRILIKDFLDIISYDKEAFTYKYSTEEIIECFKEFIKDYPLLIIDNEYTRNYLSDITNKKESLYDYFDIEHKGINTRLKFKTEVAYGIGIHITAF